MAREYTGMAMVHVHASLDNGAQICMNS